MDIKKIGLLGGRGYVGQEIIALLSHHNYLNITSIFSSSKVGEPVKLSIDSTMLYKDLSLNNIVLGDEDAYILALPNSHSKKYVDLIEHHNPKAIIVDLSADHRFDDTWEYRIPELSEQVQSNRISNPGCYASAMQFMLAPLVNILKGSVNLFGVSGYSGAGASPNERNDLEALKDNILPYSLISHLHEREAKVHSYQDLLFTPHVGNFFRGILMTGNFMLTKTLNREDILNLFIDYYKEKKLIYIQQAVPNVQKVQNNSNVIIGGFEIDSEINRLTFCCALDNLLKGAATQAVQNLNSAFGWEDTLGIS
ncbi:MAG: N-acetyl-gamma-glutamyl-phosphate reductase [Gammaproteobacteria bacterium]